MDFIITHPNQYHNQCLIKLIEAILKTLDRGLQLQKSMHCRVEAPQGIDPEDSMAGQCLHICIFGSLLALPGQPLLTAGNFSFIRYLQFEFRF